jgi:nucleoside diphosphate kinase
MANELAFVLITPYTIAKSRTGGVIARYMGRTDLRLVGARMYGPSAELAQEYADSIRAEHAGYAENTDLLADYIERSIAPDKRTGRPRRVMFLLFEGEDAVRKIWEVTGNTALKDGSGQSIRDTYGDYVLNSKGEVQYFEPAVLVAPSVERAALSLNMWAKYSRRDGGMIECATDLHEGDSIEKTLVMLKPDNFRHQSGRAGSIIDLISRAGLRIVAIKRFGMTVAQAEEFYGPVREVLRSKFRDIGLSRACSALSKEFGFEVEPEAMDSVCDVLAPRFASSQFESIVEFMTGYRPSDVARDEWATTGSVKSFGLVYEGTDAIQKIRTLIGSTDPSKAEPGSVRKEFGSNIMVNAVHASDSVENAYREMAIIRVGEDTIIPTVEEFYGAVEAK